MRTGAAKPGRGTHTGEGASGFSNRAHVHEYTIVDEGRYFTQPPLYWYFSAAWAAGSRCIYSTREGHLYLTTVPLIHTDPQCTARYAVGPCAALTGRLTALD
jgi:hypothetical protein